ncbi:MAG TPA: hypothetical protein VEL28_03940 [Candidatus Binatia bacterium]|nr:hypothetical protein [Candidatus Binatia bacterium]
MMLMDPPEKVVHTVVRATLRPRPEIAVGWNGKLVQGSQPVARGLANRIATNLTDSSIMSQPTAEPTTGSLDEPMQKGTEVEGGIRERHDAHN